MRVGQAWLFGKALSDTSLESLSGVIDPGALHRLSKAVALNSTAGLNLSPLEIANDTVGLIGNPTEAALLYLLWRSSPARDFDYAAERETNAHLLRARRPFDKKNKYMSTLYASTGATAVGKGRRGSVTESNAEKSHILYVKGAPEFVLGMCTSIAREDGESFCTVF